MKFLPLTASLMALALFSAPAFAQEEAPAQEQPPAAVEEAAARALAFPLSGSPFRANTRRVFVQDFPFALIYRPEPDGIVIFAVAHHAKRPYYWQSRVRAR